MSPEELERIAEYYDTHDVSTEIEDSVLVDSVVAEPMITTSLRLPKPIMDAIRAAADEPGIRATALMREWLEERLTQHRENGEFMVPASAMLAVLAEAAARTGATRRAS